MVCSMSSVAESIRRNTSPPIVSKFTVTCPNCGHTFTNEAARKAAKGGAVRSAKMAEKWARHRAIIARAADEVRGVDAKACGPRSRQTRWLKALWWALPADERGGFFDFDPWTNPPAREVFEAAYGGTSLGQYWGERLFGINFEVEVKE